jgi:Protein of unknown function (DUF3311)
LATILKPAFAEQPNKNVMCWQLKLSVVTWKHQVTSVAHDGSWPACELATSPGPPPEPQPGRSERAKGTGERKEMAHQNPGSRHPVAWAVLTILILAPIAGTLCVPFYARAAPKVADFPFFYWYQLIWVPIVAVTSALAYILMRRTGHPRGGPAARGGPGRPAGPAGPGGPGGPGRPAGPGPAPPGTGGQGGVQTP